MGDILVLAFQVFMFSCVFAVAHGPLIPWIIERRERRREESQASVAD